MPEMYENQAIADARHVVPDRQKFSVDLCRRFGRSRFPKADISTIDQ